MIAIVLLYVAFGMTVTVVGAFILDAAGYSLQPRDLLAMFVFWPIVLACLFAEALGKSS